MGREKTYGGRGNTKEQKLKQESSDLREGEKRALNSLSRKRPRPKNQKMIEHGGQKAKKHGLALGVGKEH